MSNLVKVSKERFFKCVGPRDIHPRPERDRSDWVDQRTHGLVGVTTPGYMCQGEVSYALRADLAEAAA